MSADMPETLHFYLRDHGPCAGQSQAWARGRRPAPELFDDRGDVILDFDDVDAVTPPFVQELLDAVQSVVRDDGSAVVTANMNEDVAETLAMVLERRKAISRTTARSGGAAQRTAPAPGWNWPRYSGSADRSP